MQNQTGGQWYVRFKLNALQSYIVVFFVVAVGLLLVSWFFQARLSSSSQLYENIIEEQKTTLTSSTSMIKDLQSKYLEMQAQYEQMKADLAQKDAKLTELEGKTAELADQLSKAELKLEAENELSSARLLYDAGKYSSARAALEKIDRGNLGPKSAQQYDRLRGILY